MWFFFGWRSNARQTTKAFAFDISFPFHLVFFNYSSFRFAVSNECTKHIVSIFVLLSNKIQQILVYT